MTQWWAVAVWNRNAQSASHERLKIEFQLSQTNGEVKQEYGSISLLLPIRAIDYSGLHNNEQCPASHNSTLLRKLHQVTKQ